MSIKENAKKYIVRNCPSCRYTPKRYIDGICWNAQKFNSSARGLCQDCTDCVIKQIVELCKSKDYFVKRFPKAQFSSGVQNSELAFDILQLFDIEEVGE